MSTTSAPHINGTRKPKTHNPVTDAERQAIRHKHRQSRNLTQKQLAAWASEAFGRPISQTTISDSLKQKFAIWDPVPVRQRVRQECHFVSTWQFVDEKVPALRAVGWDWEGGSGPLRGSEKHAIAHEICLHCSQAVQACICEIVSWTNNNSIVQGHQTTGSGKPPSKTTAAVRASAVTHTPLRSSYTPTLPFNIDPSPLWFQQLLSSLSTSIPSHRFSAYTQPDTLSAFFHHLPPLIGRSPILDSTLQSFSIYHLGFSRASPDILARARVRYGLALRMLQRAIERGRVTVETVMATTVMSIFELTTDASSEGWLNHLQGAARMMKVLGPEAFSDELGRLFVRTFSRQWVGLPPLNGRACEMMARGERVGDWRVVRGPRFAEGMREGYGHGHGHGEEGCEFDDDLKLSIVSRGRLDVFRGLGMARSVEEARPYLEELVEIRRKTRERLRVLQRKDPPVEMPARDRDGLFPIVYRYRNLCHASAHIIYRLQLLSYDPLIRRWSQHPDAGSSRPLEEQDEAFADEICMSVDFVTGAGFLGAATMAHEFRSLMLFLSPEKVTWLRMKLMLAA